MSILIKRGLFSFFQSSNAQDTQDQHLHISYIMVNLFWLCPPRWVEEGSIVDGGASGGWLDYTLCAQHHIDAHIVKIPLEASQLLYNAHHSCPATPDWRATAPKSLKNSGDAAANGGYMPMNLNNPLSVWFVLSGLI